MQLFGIRGPYKGARERGSFVHRGPRSSAGYLALFLMSWTAKDRHSDDRGPVPRLFSPNSVDQPVGTWGSGDQNPEITERVRACHSFSPSEFSRHPKLDLHHLTQIPPPISKHFNQGTQTCSWVSQLRQQIYVYPSLSPHAWTWSAPKSLIHSTQQPTDKTRCIPSSPAINHVSI